MEVTIFKNRDEEGDYHYETVEQPRYGLDDKTSAVSEIASEYAEKMGLTSEDVWDLFLSAGVVEPHMKVASDLYDQMLKYWGAECHEEVATVAQWDSLMVKMKELWEPTKQGELL
jgi:hypothetical protein